MIAKKLLCLSMMFTSLVVVAQDRKYDPPPMTLDVGSFNLSFNKLNGEGGLQTQFSWMLTGNDRQKTEIFYWPADEWQSNMLYQIFNPLVLDPNGILNQDGVRQPMYVATGNAALTNPGKTDWGREVRRYRPPIISVDGIPLTPPYIWYVDPTLKSDIKIEFEDVLGQFGIRSHVEVFGFSTPGHADYFIWKATHKFTGELKVPRETSTQRDSLPNQTIKFWWPLSFSLGPSKAGEFYVTGGFAYEAVDDLDSWFKRKSELVPNRSRDSLAVAYYYDYKTTGGSAYANLSTDDMGDPDRVNGTLHSPQIPGFALLYADNSYNNKTDDRTQPYAMPHAGINTDLWGRRDLGLLQTYRGDDNRGRFPLDPISAGILTKPDYGPMRFITVGPYELTLDRAQKRTDSLTFVYAVGAGSIGAKMADTVGKMWFKGILTDAQKDSILLTGRDSLWKVMDRANWAWDRMSRGLSIPAAPPAPDVSVTSGPDRITVSWSYPDGSYFKDANTGVDDWYAWRVYRKRGALLVNNTSDQRSGDKWELIAEIRDRTQTTYVDKTTQRGVDHYYAVTAVDNGTQNDSGLDTGLKLESSRYVTRSLLPAVSFKPGLDASGSIRVVPNPSTTAANVSSAAAGFRGTPNKIFFFNLPVKCTLRIFTETGDLVRQFNHYGTADQEWDQRTDNNQFVSSGIYILAATDCEALDGTKSDNQFVKFVIIR
jgi:hypothetical protein